MTICFFSTTVPQAAPLSNADPARDGDGSLPLPGVVARASASSATCRVLFVDPDGSKYLVRHLGMGHGTAVAQVECVSNSATKVIGIVKHLVDKFGKGSFQGVCRLHPRCMCWLSHTKNLDLLCQWLAEAGRTTRDRHIQLATELKKLVGMKVA